MKTLQERAEGYLRQIQEAQTNFETKSSAALPLLLRERYRLLSVKLFGRQWLLALESEGWDLGSPTEYLQHWRQISQAIGERYVALVLPSVSATIRNRMIQLGLPFLVPNTQIFLPLSMVNLKETYGVSHPVSGKPLSPAAQALFLIQLQTGGMQELSSKEISVRLGYSRASISMACSELEKNDLCRTYRKGKELRIGFSRPGRELWDSALPLLRSPVRKRHSVTWAQPVPEAKLAGISALSQRSGLNEDNIPSFALSMLRFQHGLERGEFNDCPDRHEAAAWIETWIYDPALLSDEQLVDPLSLYLSLREDPDERVQSELAAMMESLPWQ